MLKTIGATATLLTVLACVPAKADQPPSSYFPSDLTVEQFVLALNSTKWISPYILGLIDGHNGTVFTYQMTPEALERGPVICMTASYSPNQLSELVTQHISQASPKDRNLPGNWAPIAIMGALSEAYPCKPE